MSKLPEHLFVSCDGDLYDTRRANWSTGEPLRRGYKRHVSQLTGLHDIKAALREGSFAFPGGYPLYFIMADGDLATFDGIRSEWKNVVADTLAAANSCWVPVAVGVNYEMPGLFCCITGALIDAAYLSEEEQQELMQ